MRTSSAKSLTLESGAFFSYLGNSCLWIRTEAGPSIGFGHLKRSITLAKSLRTYTTPVFLLDLKDKWSQAHVSGEDLAFVSINLEEIWSYLPPPSGVLIDTRTETGLGGFIAEARKRGIPIVNIHDLGLNPLSADVAIDGSIVPNFHSLPDRNANCYAGTRYLVLEPSYRFFHQQEKPINKQIRMIVVNLGGGNSGKYLMKILEGLKLWNRTIEVIGIFGFTVWGQEDLARRNWHPLHFSWESESIQRLLFRADLAITAGGLAAYEALCVGTPLLALSCDHFQQITIAKLTEKGACIDLGLGSDLDPHKLLQIVTELESNPKERERLSSRGRQIVDGRGVERVSGIIQQLITEARNGRLFGGH